MWGIRTALRVFAARQQRSVSMKVIIRTITDFHFQCEKILARSFSLFRAFCGPRPRPLLTRDGGAVVRWRKGRCVSKKAFERSQKRSVSYPSSSPSLLFTHSIAHCPASLLPAANIMDVLSGAGRGRRSSSIVCEVPESREGERYDSRSWEAHDSALSQLFPSQNN